MLFLYWTCLRIICHGRISWRATTHGADWLQQILPMVMSLHVVRNCFAALFVADSLACSKTARYTRIFSGAVILQSQKVLEIKVLRFWKVLEFICGATEATCLLCIEHRVSINVWSIPVMYKPNSFFATCDERFAMDCIVALFVGNLIYLGYDRVLEKRFGESWKIYRIFRKQESTYPACGQFSSWICVHSWYCVKYLYILNIPNI